MTKNVGSKVLQFQVRKVLANNSVSDTWYFDISRRRQCRLQYGLIVIKC